MLLAAQGLRNQDIAAQLGVGRVHVSRWRKRYAQSRLAGIERDLPRGAPPVKVDVVRLVELTTQSKPEAATHWSTRIMAFEQAAAIAGTIDRQDFAWIADADPRLGPMLEAIINGRYYWVPFERLRSVHIEAPADLRDLVWAPAHFTFANGGEAVALIPTRYPGSESSDDARIRLARRTEWLELALEYVVGLGQRTFATDAGEYPLLEARLIQLDSPAEQGGET